MSSPLSPVYFTVEADLKGFIEDASSDSDYNPQVVPLSATVTFTPRINSGDIVLATNASPRPTGYIPAPITAIIDAADGRLKLRTGTDAGATGFTFAPVRLLASSPLLELTNPLEYEVSFSEVTFPNGRRGSIAGFVFEAPTTDTVVNLIEVARVPGQPQSGITKIAPGAVRLQSGNIIFSFASVDIPSAIPFTPSFTSTEMTDSTAVGRAVITSVDAAAARTAIGAENAAMKGASGGYAPLDSSAKIDAAYLPSYVDDVLSYANQAAFPATGETGKIYVAQDTGDAFRWTGSAYLRISDRVTAAGITDSTSVGRAVVTASDAAAARTAITAQRNAVFNVLDYGAVGNGVANENTAITAAITAANAAGGGIVFLPSGTYLISAPLDLAGSNVTMQGAGRSATIVKTVGNHEIIRGSGASGVVVRDLQVLGDADAAKTIQRGIQFQNMTDSLIDNVWAKNLGYDGILLLGGNVNCAVSNCRVSGCRDDGINIGGDPSAATIGTVVTGNVISDSLNVGIHISDRSSFSSVTGNTITGCDSGIDTYQATYSGMGNNSIVGNTIRGCTNYGVRIFNSDNNAVTGNSIDGSPIGMRAESSSTCLFASNIVSGATTYGFRDDSFCSETTVADNIISGAGILLDSPRGLVRGNNLRGVANSIRCGSGATAASVQGNTITDGTGNDIEIQVTQASVVGNLIDSSATKCIATSGSGTKCLIVGNTIKGGQRGIEVATADCLVSGNYLNAQTVFGIYSAAAARAHFVGNRMVGTQVAINIFGAADTYISDNVTVSTVGTNSITENNTSSGTILADNRLDKVASLLGTSPIEIKPTAELAGWSTKTLPTGAVVGTSDTQTLTQKTLTSATLTTPAIDGTVTGTGVATANTASTLVQRDASGNFSAGTITASLSGNATTATSATTATTAGNVSGTVAVTNGGSGATTLTGVLKGNGTDAFTVATAGTDYVAPGGALGTPSSGTLTNTTGLPVSGITASTTTALGVGSIELGHASDTTLTRSAAGVLAVEGVDVPTVSSTSTLTNKTITSPKVNQLLDTNGNVSLVLGATASAVNYLQINNGAAGTSAGGFVAAGASTDLNIDFTPKGAGILRVNGVAVLTTTNAVTLTNKTLTSPKITSGSVPASATATGTTGQIQWDADYIYVCTATNTWKRTAISTW